MSSLHNDYLEQQFENLLEEKEAQHVQEEAHQHFVTEEFSNLILNVGPTVMFNKLCKEAKEELMMAVFLGGTNDGFRQ